MIDTLVSFHKKQLKKKKYIENPLNNISEFFLDNPQLSVSICKKEDGIVIKIKKNKN